MAHEAVLRLRRAKDEMEAEVIPLEGSVPGFGKAALFIATLFPRAWRRVNSRVRPKRAASHSNRVTSQTVEMSRDERNSRLPRSARVRAIHTG
jgi:hypothetical protein